MRTGSVGIDVGGSKTLFELFDAKLSPIHQIKVKTPGKDSKKFTEIVLDSVDSLLKKSKQHGLKISAVGVGCAGTIDTAKNVVKISPNIPALTNYSFSTVLRKLTPAPVRLYNDVNAALYGELKCGAAIGYKHVIAVFIGTGVGAAIAIDGKLYTGASNHAGNIGQFLLHPLGLATGSRRLGILDNLVSRTSIAAEAAVLAAKHQAPHLSDIAGADVTDIKSNELAKAIRKGDKAIEDLVRTRARVLGIALASVVDFLNPEMIVLGGGLTKAMPSLIRGEVLAGVKAHATPAVMRDLLIAVSKLKSHAVPLGAAKLALDAVRG